MNILIGLDEKGLSVLMHEVRSPINALLGIVEQTKLNLNSKAEIVNSLDKIEGVASYLLSLSNNFLEITKNETAYVASEDKSFNFKEVLNYVVSVFNFQFDMKKIKFVKNIIKSDVIVFGDPIKLKQILINVLSNSYKYTASKGQVLLSCDYKYKTEEDLEFRIIVKDNGIGMSKEFLNRIFTPYSCETNTIKPKGTGLGLCIIKDSIQKMNGKLSIDSQRGVGTTVKIIIPLKVVKHSYDFNNKRLLVIDDCSITRQILKRIIESHGGVCDQANNGKQGLDMFISSPAKYYSAILLDNNMDELSGEEVARKIREYKRADSKNIPIIGLSASNSEDDIKRCINSGMDDYLLKPLSKENLLSIISKRIKNMDLII